MAAGAELCYENAPVPDVPFFHQRRSAQDILPRVGELVRGALESGALIQGPLTRTLEEELATLVGVRHAVAVGNGTDALVIALRSLGIGPGDEVIVPAYTFFASASSVAHVGAVPVFVDVRPDDYALDPEEVDGAVTDRTRAVMPVHLFHQMAPMDDVMAVAGRRGLAVLEDSAEAIGMRWGDRHAGSIGDVGTLSFFPTKTLGGLGDGGMILTDDDGLADFCRTVANHGQRPDADPYVWSLPGFNSRLDEFNAAVLLAKLARLDADIARRAELAARYDEALRDLAPSVVTPRLAAGTASSVVFYVYLIEADRRDELQKELDAAGIGTEVYYPVPLPAQPCFAGERPSFPVAEAAAARALALPLYPDLTDGEVDHVCDVIRRFYGDDR